MGQTRVSRRSRLRRLPNIEPQAARMTQRADATQTPALQAICSAASQALGQWGVLVAHTKRRRRLLHHYAQP